MHSFSKLEVLFYLVMPMIFMATILRITLSLKKRKFKNRHLEEYTDVAPESTVYHEYKRKK
jgi:hypothetical protein